METAASSAKPITNESLTFALPINSSPNSNNMANDNINIGIVGLGFMAAMHIRAYRQIEGVNVAAICDLDPERLKGDFTSALGNLDSGDPVILDMSQVKAYQDFNDLLADESIDAIDICTPTRTHLRMTKPALASGKSRSGRSRQRLKLSITYWIQTTVASSTYASSVIDSITLDAHSFDSRPGSVLNLCTRSMASAERPDTESCSPETIIGVRASERSLQRLHSNACRASDIA